MVGPTMNLISRTHHSCEREEHAFMVLREYTIISPHINRIIWLRWGNIYIYIYIYNFFDFIFNFLIFHKSDVKFFLKWLIILGKTFWLIVWNIVIHWYFPDYLLIGSRVITVFLIEKVPFFFSRKHVVPM